MKATVLIIGSSGQIGTILEGYLKNRGYRVLTLNRSGNSTLPFLLHTEDSLDDQVIEELSSDRFSQIIMRFDVSNIIHCASPRGNIESLRNVDFQTLKLINYDVTESLIKALLDTGFKTSLTFMASSAMYVPHAPLTIIDEESEPNPISPYGLVKRDTVKLIDECRAKYKLNAHSIILFNQESPLRQKGFLFNELAHKLSSYLRGETKVISVKDKYRTVDWSDARDLPSLIELCFSKRTFDNYVAASGRLQTIESLLMETCVLMGLEITEELILSDMSSIPVNSSLMGNPRKALDLGWQGSRRVSTTLSEFTSKLLAKNSY